MASASAKKVTVELSVKRLGTSASAVAMGMVFAGRERRFASAAMVFMELPATEVHILATYALTIVWDGATALMERASVSQVFMGLIVVASQMCVFTHVLLMVFAGKANAYVTMVTRAKTARQQCLRPASVHQAAPETVSV
jgi:hypothetical protein